MFNNLGVGARVTVTGAAVVLLFIVTFVAVGMSLMHLTEGVRQIDEKTVPYIVVVDEMDLGRSEVQQFLTDVSATHDRDGYKEAEESAKIFLRGVGKFKQLYRQENDTYNLQQIESIEADFNKFYASGKVMAEAYINSGIEAGNLLMKGGEGIAGFDQDSETIATGLVKFREQLLAEAGKTTDGALNDAQFTMMLMVASCLASVLIAVILGVWVVRSVLRQLGGEPAYAAEVISKIAEGDLTLKVQTKAGDSKSLLFVIKMMVDKLAEVVGEVRAATDTITVAAQEIAAGNSDLSQRTEQQASSLEETASSMEELTSTVKQNAENAKQANQLAASASDIAVKGGLAVNDVVQTMASISNSSKRIGDIISVIEGIAFQTNILALNAAVEAARAGEQGRGFAVVAGEVRNLAQRSASAAKEIKTLIDDSVGKVDAGSIQVDQAGVTMNEIVQAVKRVTDIMAEISAASDEQRAGIEEVNQSIVLVDDMTQQNAALVEQAAAAAEAMQDQAVALKNAVGIFRLESGHEVERQAIASKPTVQSTTSHSVNTLVPSRKRGELVSANTDKHEDWKEF